MATGGLGMGTAPASAPSNLLAQKLRAEAVVKAAAGWFLWVAALSVVNSFLSMSGSGIRFIVGLALYAVDGLILLSLKDVLGTAFHAYALYRMYRGIAVIPVLQRIEQAMAPAGAPIVPK